MPGRRSPLAVVSVLLGVAALGVIVLAMPARAGTEGWRWPLAAPHTVVRGFQPPPQPWLPGHRGVDLAGTAGEVVRAAGAGVVRFAGRVGGVPVVSVAHPGGLLTTYEPVHARVRAGRAVRAGEPVGTLVPTGSHCAPAACLHWGLRRGDAYLDPLALLGLGRVRLLPMPLGGSVAAGRSPPAGRASAGSAATVVVAVLLGATPLRSWRRRHRSASTATPGSAGAGASASRAGRPASRAAAGPPSCASGRSGFP